MTSQKFQAPIILSPEDIREENSEEGAKSSTARSQVEPIASPATSLPKAPKKKSNAWLLAGFLLVLGYSIFEMVLFINYLLSTSLILALFFGICLTVFAGGLIRFIIKEFKARKKYKANQRFQHQEENIDTPASFGQAESLLAEVHASLPQDMADRDFLNQDKGNLNDQEWLQLYANTVLKALDERAKQVIAKHAAETAAIIALSPLALLDMLLIFWRSIAMAKAIAEIYGYSGGILTRFTILKAVLKNMVFAGANEMLGDMGSDVLGGKLAAGLSIRIAQGIGAGILTARLGLAIVKTCRPLKKESPVKMKISHLRTGVIEHLKTQFSSWVGGGKGVVKSEEKVK